MKLRFREIEREREVEVTETLSAETFSIDTPDHPVLTSPVKVDVKATFQDGSVWAWVKAEVGLTLLCARCLDRFALPLSLSFDFRMGPEQDEIAVDDEVRQQILLALPVQPLCSTDCRGLCPVCGSNLNSRACGCPRGEKPTPFDVLKNLKIR